MTAGQPQYADIGPVLNGMAGIVTPPPDRTADEWADENRILPFGTAMPGKWDTDFTPYMRPIYRAFSDPRYDEIVIVMGSQMSKTELFLNVFGHRFDDGPYVPCLYVGPTQKHVSSMSRDRFRKLIESTPSLADKLHVGQEDKVTEKFFAGVRMGFAWAGSATELASHPAGLVLMDERDRMDNDVGGEGDPFELALARGETYADFKIGVVSTPTAEGGSAIMVLYEGGSMMKWAFLCLHCHGHFVPTAALLKYPKDGDDDVVRKGARVVCPLCGAEHRNKDKYKMNEHGIMVPHVLDVTTGEHKQVAEPVPNSRASFQVSGLASPMPRAHWGIRANQLRKAYRSKEQTTLQTVINTRFGEVFRLKGDAPEWEIVSALSQPVARGDVPAWAGLLAMGTDVQKDGLHYVIRAFGFDREAKTQRSHAIDDGFIFGDTEFDDVWLQWQAILFETYEGRSIGVSLVDSGFNPARDRFKRPEHKVYEACRRTNWKALPSKGHDTQGSPVILSKLDRSPTGRAMPGLRLWHIDTDHFKTKIHGRIRISAESDDPVWTVHAEIDDDYCKQVVAEELIVKSSGVRSWLCPNHRANHKLDCEVLCEAGAYIYRAKTYQTLQPATPKPPEPQKKPNSFVQGGAHPGRTGGRPFIS